MRCVSSTAIDDTTGVLPPTGLEKVTRYLRVWLAFLRDCLSKKGFLPRFVIISAVSENHGTTASAQKSWGKTGSTTYHWQNTSTSVFYSSNPFALVYLLLLKYHPPRNRQVRRPLCGQGPFFLSFLSYSCFAVVSARSCRLLQQFQTFVKKGKNRYLLSLPDEHFREAPV